MISNPSAQYNFSGAGFTALNLDIRQPPNINQGAITNQSFTQPLSDILFDNATGAISFVVAENPEDVRDITFTGNAITDAGFAIGFTGTWKGERMPVIRTEKAAEREREGAALPIPPPNNSLTVEGNWSATLANQII